MSRFVHISGVHITGNGLLSTVSMNLPKGPSEAATVHIAAGLTPPHHA